MLYPQQNSSRTLFDLSGIWDFQPDPDEVGVAQGFTSALPSPSSLAVPGSWNEQYADLYDYLGMGWYLRRVHIPASWKGQCIFLRVGSANYRAVVWVNGRNAGEHEGGHLPFEFEITPLVKSSVNQLVVRVDARLAFDRVPPGNVTGDDQDFFASHAGNFPQAQFDFFPFCGIHRPVLLYATHPDYIGNITVETRSAGQQSKVHIHC